MLLLAVTLPFHSTFLARLVAVPFAVGTCVAVYATRARARRRPAVEPARGPVLAATPVFARTSLVGANTDPEFLFFVVGGGADPLSADARRSAGSPRWPWGSRWGRSGTR